MEPRMTIRIGWDYEFMKVSSLLTEFGNRGYFQTEKALVTVDVEKDKAVFHIDGISHDNARFLGNVLKIAIDGKLEWEYSKENA